MFGCVCRPYRALVGEDILVRRRLGQVELEAFRSMAGVFALEVFLAHFRTLAEEIGKIGSLCWKISEREARKLSSVAAVVARPVGLAQAVSAIDVKSRTSAVFCLESCLVGTLSLIIMGSVSLRPKI